MLNVIEADNCWDLYLKSLKMLIDSKNLDARNVFMQVNSTDDNYICSLPDIPDPLAWYLRVNSDVVEGELGIGVGLDVRYSQKRLGRVKGHGSYDWGFREETGRPVPALNLIMEDDVFPNVGRVGGNGQLHYVKDLLLLDSSSDKGIVTFWNWKRDLLEYTKRKFYSPLVVGEESWSDSQHQRIPCPVSWHFTSTAEGINNSVYSRSMVWDKHIHDDVFRFTEPAKWIGGHTRKKSGILTMNVQRLWVQSYDSDVKDRLTDLYDFWTSNNPISSYYEPNFFSLYASKEDFERDWQLKELAEQDYRLGAFEEGDKKLELISSEYYKDWVRVIKVAEMTISHNLLGKMFRRGIHSRGTKRAMEYIEEYGFKRAINDIKGVFKVQTVQWFINYLLRSKYEVAEYKEYLELLPEDLQQLVLLSSLDRVKEPVVEEILPLIDSKYKRLHEEFRSTVVDTTPVANIKTMEEEDVRNPIKTESKVRYLVVDPYGGERVNRRNPALIKMLRERGEIDLCYFPIEPFHYREKKRHATEDCFKACIESFTPISVETRQEVPDWAIDALSRHKNSEIRIQIGTLDEKKHKLLYKNSATPEELMNSFIRCFNGGVYTILKVSPIVPVIITPYDVFKVVEMVKNLTEKVEICFASFNEEEFEKLKEKLPKKYAEAIDFYELANGRYFVKESYRAEFLRKLKGYTEGLRLKLEIINEVSIKDGEVIGKLNIEE